MSAGVSQQGVVQRVTESTLPTQHGTFRIVGYRGLDGVEHVAMCSGIEDGAAPLATAPLVRAHSECLTGDVLGSYRCDCGEQLDAALARIATEPGVVLYLRGHEGRGIGLVEKLRAYKLQDEGLDTVEANLQLGHPADRRDYSAAADMLRDLGIPRVRLLSSNPAKEQALATLGIDVVERVSLVIPDRPENAFYLETKRVKMRHDRPAAPLEHLWNPDHLNGDVASLEATYEELDREGGWLIAQSAQSLDGFIATRDGQGAGLSGQQDLTHLHRLRSLADAVVVGATTVVNDAPRLTVRLVEGRSPVRVVLDPTGRVPADAGVFIDALAPTLRVVGEAVAPLDGVTDIVLSAPFTPADIRDALAARGLHKVLVEGGGRTVSRFLTDGALDRLFVTLVPMFLGDGIPGVRPTERDSIPGALTAPTRQHQLGDDVCLEFRW